MAARTLQSITSSRELLTDIELQLGRIPINSNQSHQFNFFPSYLSSEPLLAGLLCAAVRYLAGPCCGPSRLPQARGRTTGGPRGRPEARILGDLVVSPPPREECPRTSPPPPRSGPGRRHRSATAPPPPRTLTAVVAAAVAPHRRRRRPKRPRRSTTGQNMTEDEEMGDDLDEVYP